MPRVLSNETLEEIEALTRRYPTRLGALLPSLHLAQRKHGHLSPDVQHDIAEKLDVPPARVTEVVTFYTMFHDEKVGRNVVKLCRNLACQLRGADRLIARAEQKLGIKCGDTTGDGRVTLEKDECLGSCGTGPMLWWNDEFVENLDEKKLDDFLAGLK